MEFDSQLTHMLACLRAHTLTRVSVWMRVCARMIKHWPAGKAMAQVELQDALPRLALFYGMQCC